MIPASTRPHFDLTSLREHAHYRATGRLIALGAGLTDPTVSDFSWRSLPAAIEDLHGCLPGSTGAGARQMHTERDFLEIVAAGCDPRETQPNDTARTCREVGCDLLTRHQMRGCDAHYLRPSIIDRSVDVETVAA